jgi:IclR family acetate operon transcriptional repressor
LRRVLGNGPLKRYTDRTITSLDALEKALRKIRADRVGTDIGEYLEGSVCLAVPVTDRDGRYCAMVAVHGPAPRMTLKTGVEYLPALRRAANALSETFAEKSTGGTS